MDDSFPDLELTGRVNSKGQPMFSGIDQWNAFFKHFPDKAFICNIQILEPGSNEHMVWFYVKVALNQIQKQIAKQGTIMDLIEIDSMLCSELHFSKQLFDFDKWQPINECTTFELVMFIESVNQYAAEHLGLIITKIV